MDKRKLRMIAYCLMLIVLLVQIMPMIGILYKVSALVALCVVLWGTGAVPEWFTAFTFYLGAIIGHLAPTPVILSGMTSSVVWLVFSGIILGAAIKFTQLDKVMARWIMPYCKDSYSRVMMAVMALGMILIFVMPSAMGRIMLVIPILSAISESLGYEKGSREYDGLLIGGLLATYFPAFAVLTSNIPINILAGTLDSIYGQTFSYGTYLVDFYPIWGILKCLATFGLVMMLYRHCRPPQVLLAIGADMESSTDDSSEGTTSVKEPLTKEQKRMLIILIGTLLLWVTEHWHGIPTGWVGMLAAFFCLLPGANLMPKEKPLRTVGLEPFFFVGGIIGMSGLVQSSGLAKIIAEYLIDLVHHMEPTTFMYVAIWIGVCMVVGLLTTVTGIPAIVSPIMGSFSSVSGLSLQLLSNLQVIGISSFLFLYQSPPLTVAMQAAELNRRNLFIICFLMTILNLVIFTPLSLLQWGL